MNIAIFETQHFEGAYPMIRIMDMPGNHLTIFVNEATYQRFNALFGNSMEKYTWVVQPARLSNRKFVWRIFQTCRRNKTNILFLNTVTANFMLYAFAAMFLRARVILTLHDANNFLLSHYSHNLRLSVRHAGKAMLARCCYAYSTVSETVQAHLKNTMRIKKKIFCIPGAVFEKQGAAIPIFDGSGPLRIVVAGSIDKRRRNYEEVLSLLELANRQELPLHIELSGGPYGAYGRRMMETFRAYNLEHRNLVFHETPVVDQPVFDAALDKAHFLWIPSVINTVIADGIEETYGVTKSSGNIFDAIKHARPMLVPAGLAMPVQLQSSTVVYSSTTALKDLLAGILQNPASYAMLATAALHNSKQYSVEKMRERIPELLYSDFI